MLKLSEVRITLVFALSSLLLFSLVSCKKSGSEPAPTAITVEASAAAIELNNTSTVASGFSASFQYEGVTYSVSANQVPAGSETGSISFSKTDIFSSSSRLSGLYDGLSINNMSTPFDIHIHLNSFPMVYGTTGSVGAVDVHLFNDITLHVTANSLFYFYSPNDNSFVNTYTNDVDGFKALSMKLLSSFNDNDLSTSGNQPMAVNPNVYK